jgi:hypothetical protein
MSETIQNGENEESRNRYILPIGVIENSERPTECLPCNYNFRVREPEAVLIERYHPYYTGGRMTGLCREHAEAIDLEYIGYT